MPALRQGPAAPLNAPQARRRGLFVAAALLGLSPLPAGWLALARGVAASRAAVDLIEPVEREPAARVSAGPHLPRGCVLRLKPGRAERWDVLVEKGPLGELPGATVGADCSCEDGCLRYDKAPLRR